MSSVKCAVVALPFGRLPGRLPGETTPTLTATLSPPGILEIGHELLLTSPLENRFDSSQRS